MAWRREVGDGRCRAWLKLEQGAATREAPMRRGSATRQLGTTPVWISGKVSTEKERQAAQHECRYRTGCQPRTSERMGGDAMLAR